MIPNDFTVTIRDSDDDINIAVGGELDMLTTPDLTIALDAAVDRSRRLTIDLANVTFIDSTAIQALVRAQRALTATGHRLRLDNPSAIVTRALVVMGPAHHFDNPTDVENPPPTQAEDDLQSVLNELARRLLTERSLRADLERLIRFTCDTIGHCDAASIALLIDGQPSTVATTEHLALELDIAQYDHAEGPCLTALDGRPIRVDVLAADERFTHFACGAADHRINSVLSMPATHQDRVIGTLNLYAHAANAFTDDDTGIAHIAATQAAHAIVRSDLAATALRLRDRLQADYDEATLTARAQGILISLQQCSAEQARHLLTNAATATDSSLTATAQRILDAARADAVDRE